MVDSGTSNFEAVQASGENVFEGCGAGYPSSKGRCSSPGSRVAGWRSTHSSERSAAFLSSGSRTIAMRRSRAI